eukprot:1190159-Prorocentrum_minimum.AAC.3
MDPAVFGYLEPIKLKHSADLRVAESSIHGRGVFATADIPAGRLPTFSPFHPAHFHTFLRAFIYTPGISDWRKTWVWALGRLTPSIRCTP